MARKTKADAGDRMAGRVGSLADDCSVEYLCELRRHVDSWFQNIDTALDKKISELESKGKL